MDPMPTDMLLLKTEGNTHIKNGQYQQAIECYDKALLLAKSIAHVIILLLNRCHARLHTQQFDPAFADAMAIIDICADKPPEKALFRAARALYGLQKWKESLRYLEILVTHSSDNKEAHRDITRCKQRLQEQTGHYDFKAMLEEAAAKAPSPDMDRANFIGPVEVRGCEIKSHGRGLFTTRSVKAGELLLCEKAFATVFADSIQPTEPSKHIKEGCSDTDDVGISLGSRDRLTGRTLLKLLTNPSLQAPFGDLFPGPDWIDEVDEETGLTIVEDDFVTSRIAYNNFGFPIFTHQYHWIISHHPEKLLNETASIGIWIQASYINHSCYPMVRRSFIGDMMIFRAQQNIPANTELKFGYISGLEDYEERQSRLSKYGFACECQICEAEKNTSRKKMKHRKRILAEIVDIFEKGDVTGFDTYTELLENLEKTYANPPRKEYRRSMIHPITNLMSGCLSSDMPHQVIELSHRLLHGLGFELEITHSSFRILQWGFLIDELIVMLVDLRDAYRSFNIDLARDAEREAKLGYLIMCGEDVSWDSAYGPGGKRERGEGAIGWEELEQEVESLNVN